MVSSYSQVVIPMCVQLATTCAAVGSTGRCLPEKKNVLFFFSFYFLIFLIFYFPHQNNNNKKRRLPFGKSGTNLKLIVKPFSFFFF